ncbi:hypothetical protein MJT46_009035 [Ovis ammon polii x Ovis aries]|nr:hypothetical protein MJT46_009035 [Ovis ammon polii x Ovis aries]
MRVCRSLRALQRTHATVRDSMLPLPSCPAEAVALNHLKAWHQVKQAEGHVEAKLANTSDSKNVQQWISQSTSHLDLPGGTVGASQGRESAPFQLQPSEVSTLRTDPLPGRLQRTGDWRGRTRNGRIGVSTAVHPLGKRSPLSPAFGERQAFRPVKMY